VRKAGKRLRQRLQAAHEAEPDQRDPALHAVRIAAKRVRYATEVAVDELGKPAKRLVKTMTKVQDMLGELQDTVVTRQQCRRLGIAASAAGENGFTFGLLHGLEEARAARGRAAFAELEPDLLPTLRAVTRS
jgi:CHAD domain-containing protein